MRTICLGFSHRGEFRIEDCHECVQFLSAYDSSRLDPRFTRILVKQHLLWDKKTELYNPPEGNFEGFLMYHAWGQYFQDKAEGQPQETESYIRSEHNLGGRETWVPVLTLPHICCKLLGQVTSTLNFHIYNIRVITCTS